MGEDTYIKELKEGAVGNKLPTMIDLNPETSSGGAGHLEVPTARRAAPKGGVEIDSTRNDEKIKTEIMREIQMLHSSGKSIDEMFAILDRKGYEYKYVEPLLMDFLKGEKSVSKPASGPAFGSNAGMETQVPEGTSKPTLRVPPTQTQNSPQMPPPPHQPPPQMHPSISPTQAPKPQIFFKKKDGVMPAPPTPETASAQTRPVSHPTLNGSKPDFHPNTPISSGTSPVEELPTASSELMEQPMEVTKQPLEDIKSAEKESGEFAPLFVRVGKYKEVLETLEDLDSYLQAMSRLFGLVEELEKVRVMNIAVLKKMYKNALETSAKLSSGLLKPRGMHLEGRTETRTELGRLDDVISDLNKELSALKVEVEKLSKVD